jgi:hypothetical protein
MRFFRRDMATESLTAARAREGAGASAALAWLAAFLVAAVALVATHYQSADPDTRLHTLLTTHLASLPPSRWIAPEWWGFPGWKGAGGLYREHPVGILLLPTIIAKLGYPASQAPLLINAVFEIFTIVLIQRLAAFLVSPLEARALAWQIQLIPIAFTFRIRANHEQAVLLFVLAALYGVERSRRSAPWIALVVAAVVATTLVKGIFFVPALLCCAVWLWIVRAPADARRGDAAAWFGLVLAGLAAVGVGAGYELLYRHITGVSFLSFYLGTQLGRAAEPHSAYHFFRKFYNFAWYMARVLWFGAPVSLAAGAAAWRYRRDFVHALEKRALGGRTPAEQRARQGLVFAVAIAVFYAALFSLSDRESIRYIFPAYYLFAAAGFVVLMRTCPPFSRFSERLDRYHPVVPAAVWLATFFLSLSAGLLRIPRLKFWSLPGS